MSRNKARNGAPKEENEEELAMWSQMKNTLKKLATIQTRQQQISQEIVDLEKKIIGSQGASREDEEIAREQLEALYREDLRLTSDEKGILDGEPHDLIKNVEILAALRSHTENSQQQSQQSSQRGPAPNKNRKSKGSKSDIDMAMESPALSVGSGPSVARIKSMTARGASVGSSRDGRESVKGDEGSGGGSGSVDGLLKGPAAERAGKLVVHAEVAYRQAKPKEDGSQWIQCTIVSVTEAGNKKRYEVQDEPDESGAPGDIYKASAAALIAIPSKGAPLPDFPVGKHVLARYPETTTFYRAEVTGMKKDFCKLKFEDDQNQEMEVDRRYVLDMGIK